MEHSLSVAQKIIEKAESINAYFIVVGTKDTSNVVNKWIDTNAQKVMIITFKKVMILKEHKTHLPAMMTVLKGKVNYRNQDSVTTIDEYDNFQISVQQSHRVEAVEDSICLLSQG